MSLSAVYFAYFVQSPKCSSSFHWKPLQCLSKLNKQLSDNDFWALHTPPPPPPPPPPHWKWSPNSYHVCVRKQILARMVPPFFDYLIILGMHCIWEHTHCGNVTCNSRLMHNSYFAEVPAMKFYGPDWYDLCVFYYSRYPVAKEMFFPENLR